MTDNDIIKALEWHLNRETHCNKCPYKEFKNRNDENCVGRMLTNALDLIKRKETEIEKLNVELVGMRGACESYKIHYDNAQAEIERLREENKNQKLVIEEIEDTINPLPFETDFEKAIRIAKSEAIKEFIKRFEKKIKDVKFTIGQTWEIECALEQTLKEMTEGCENG